MADTTRVLAHGAGVSGVVRSAVATPEGISYSPYLQNHSHGVPVVNVSVWNAVPYVTPKGNCASDKKSGGRCGSLVDAGTEFCFYHREGGPVGPLVGVDKTKDV